MKKTGIVRKLDDLGRVVIPKEIRSGFGIDEGDEIEFFIDDNKIVLRKFSLLESLEEEIYKIIQSYNNKYRNSISIVEQKNLLIGYGKEINKIEDFIQKISEFDVKNENINRYFENKECFYVGHLYEKSYIIVHEENPINERELEVIRYIKEIIIKLLRKS